MVLKNGLVVGVGLIGLLGFTVGLLVVEGVLRL